MLHIFLPLIMNLLWAIIVMAVLPKIFGTSLSVLVTGMPDIGYTLVFSGLIALIWGPLRTGLAYFALRTAGAGSRTGELVKV